MVKKQTSSNNKLNLSSVVAWLVGILVSLAVGSGMIRANKVVDTGLWIPGIPDIIVVVAGWIVVIGVIISIVAAIFKR